MGPRAARSSIVATSRVLVAVPADDSEPGGEIAASYSMIPRRFWIDGSERLGALSLDTLTTPRWRKRGLFTHLARESYSLAAGEGLDFVYGFPNPNSIHGFVKHLGWKLLPSPEILVNVRPLEWAVGWLRAGSQTERRGAGRARILPEADERLDDLWRRSRGRICIGAVRDAAFFRWRLARPATRYRLAVAESDDGTVLAACVTVVFPRPEGPRGYLVDLLAPEGEDATLAWLIRFATSRLVREDRVKLIQAAISPSSPWLPCLRSAGFRPAPSRLRTEMKFGWCPLSRDLLEVGDTSGRWHATYADSDTA